MNTESLPPGEGSEYEVGFAPGRPPDYSREVQDDIQTPWGWPDLLLLVLVTLLFAFVIGGLVTMAFLAHGVTRAQLSSSEREKSLLILTLQPLLYGAILGYLYLRIISAGRRSFWRTMGWRELYGISVPRAYLYLGSLIAGGGLCLLVTLASEAYGTKAKLPIEQFFQDRETALLFVLLAVLVAPLVEETIFRGYIYPVVARSFGISAGVVITGIAFGLMHEQQLAGGWVQIGLLIVVGIVLTYARARSRTVVASYLMHLGYNSFIALAFLLSPHGYRSLPWR
jgi:membrane protease YdiL (CAAX protease family)